MITVLAARNQRGWSPCDYMIKEEDDHALAAAIVGRSFRSIRDALRAAQTKAHSEAYAILTVRMANGSIWEVGAEPDLPGRPALRRRVK